MTTIWVFIVVSALIAGPFFPELLLGALGLIARWMNGEPHANGSIGAIDPTPSPHPRCARCGYDLTGNVSGKCPECGASLTEGGVIAPGQPGRKRDWARRANIAFWIVAVLVSLACAAYAAHLWNSIARQIPISTSVTPPPQRP